MRRTLARPIARTVRVALLTALVATALVARSGEVSAASATPVADPARVWSHLVALQEIADREGGNRTTGSPGYAASEAHAVASLEQAGWQVTVQRFTLPGTVPTDPPALSQTGPVPATYDMGTDFALTTPPSGDDVDAPLALVGISGVPGPGDGSTACEPDAFDAFPPDAIALVVHGSCDPLLVMINAFSAGAAGVGFISDGTPGEQDPVQVDVGIGLGLASFSLSHALGASLVQQVRSVGPVTLNFDSGWRPGTVTSSNVIAERPGTDPSRVLVLGAHLDSVPQGPGISDNGSGVAALLALAEAWGASGAATGPTLRIGLWGAEELGLLGSQAYVGSLSATDRAAITTYLNFDQLGSRNGFPFVYDPATASMPETVSPGSDALTVRFRRHFAAAGIPTEGIWTDGRSDDRFFAEAGIPVGGLFSGAEQPKTGEQADAYGGTAGESFDTCYHLECDDLDGVNVTLLNQLVGGISAVVGELAEVGVGPTTTTTTATVSGSTMPVATPIAGPVVAAPAFTG